MYFVTQTNVPEPRQDVTNTIEEARTLASKLCPRPGDTALIYQLVKVERVSTHQTQTYEEFNAEYERLNAEYREEDLSSLMGDIE